MNKNTVHFLLLIVLLFTFNLPVFSQSEMYGETSETILQRESFILDRRAGGPGKVLPFDAYPKAMEQKKNIPDASTLPGNPFNLIGWVSVNPTGMFYNRTGANYISGRTNGIAFHPTDANTIYIAAAQGGVWKTTDGGLNWTQLTDGLSSLAGGDVAVDQSNPNIIYYGTGELNFSLDSQYGDGIFKSTDAGATWTQVTTAATVGSYISQIAIDPTNSQIVYAATTTGTYKSTNGGTSWTSTSTGADVNCVIIDPSNTQNIYVTTGGYYAGLIRKSTNAGSTWTTLSSGLPVSNKGRIQLAMAPSNSLIIYASIASSLSYALLALSKTTDGGSTWSTTATSPNPLGSQGWYDNAISVNSSDPNIVLVAGLDVYTSTDGGVTLVQKTSWSTASSSIFSHADIHRLAFRGSVLYCGSDGGVYKSTNNGTNWSDLNQTLSTLQFQSADYDPSSVVRLYAGSQDNDKETSSNGGTNWIQRTTGDGGYTVVDPVTTNYVYQQYVNGSLLRSTNYGVSFTEIKPSGSSGGLFYNPFEMAPGDHNTIVYGQADVWKTITAQLATSGSGWTQIATSATIGGSVSAIGISTLTTSKIYIGTSAGKILVTTNNGGSWSSLTGFPYVTDFAVDPSNDNICYASFGGSASTNVQKTTNGGTSWTNIHGTLPNIAANTLILKTLVTRVLVVGMDAGVYYTSDEGSSWTGINTNLPAVQVYDLKYHESVGLLMAATHGRGAWTFSDAPMPVIIVYFNSEIDRRDITLKWATQQEINNSGFEIERMSLTEGFSGNWNKIGFIRGNGTTNETKYYVFKDSKLSSGKYRYRLKQIDYNNNYEFFNLLNDVVVGIPHSFGISQNYPNPSNPKSKIDYEIPYDGKVTIKVFDINGREITILVNETRTAGYYSIDFDGTNLASGVYFYRISLESIGMNGTKTMKMLLVK